MSPTACGCDQTPVRGAAVAAGAVGAADGSGDGDALDGGGPEGLAEGAAVDALGEAEAAGSSELHAPAKTANVMAAVTVRILHVVTWVPPGSIDLGATQFSGARQALEKAIVNGQRFCHRLIGQ